MLNNFVGIKMADGTFFPILSGIEAVRKKLVLTTVFDEQPGVQIDLYRSEDQEFSSPEYIGSMVLESIPAQEAGKIDIEVVIGVNEFGQLEASATELLSGNVQKLSVSLQDLSSRSLYDLPEPEINEIEEDTSFEDPSFSSIDTNTLTENPYKKKKGIFGFLFVLIGVLVIFLGALLISRLFKEKEAPPLVAQQQVQVTENSPAEEIIDDGAVDEIIGEELVSGISDQSTPVLQQAAPQSNNTEAIVYMIRRGDTLWDLSFYYYKDYFKYYEIAHFNDIKNPDLIYEGDDLLLPELAP